MHGGTVRRVPARRRLMNAGLGLLMVIGVLGTGAGSASAGKWEDPADSPATQTRCGPNQKRVFVQDDEFRDMIAGNEGAKLAALAPKGHVYPDANWNHRVGVGFRLDRPGAREKLAAVRANYDDVLAGRTDLTPDQMVMLFEVDFREIMQVTYTVLPELERVESTRRAAVLDQVFYVGPDRIGELQRLFDAVKRRDWLAAYSEMSPRGEFNDLMRVGSRCEYVTPTTGVGIVSVPPEPRQYGLPVIPFPPSRYKFPVLGPTLSRPLTAPCVSMTVEVWNEGRLIGTAKITVTCAWTYVGYEITFV